MPPIIELAMQRLTDGSLSAELRAYQRHSVTLLASALCPAHRGRSPSPPRTIAADDPRRRHRICTTQTLRSG